MSSLDPSPENHLVDQPDDPAITDQEAAAAHAARAAQSNMNWHSAISGSINGSSGSSVPSAHPATSTPANQAGANTSLGASLGSASGSTSTVVYPAAGASYAVAASLGHSSITQPTAKSRVEFIVVTAGGQCLELKEQNPITPREMIGICKFIMAAGAALQGGLRVDWTDVIYELGITDHFDAGMSSHTLYDDDDCMYIKLFCA